MAFLAVRRINNLPSTFKSTTELANLRFVARLLSVRENHCFINIKFFISILFGKIYLY